MKQGTIFSGSSEIELAGKPSTRDSEFVKDIFSDAGNEKVRNKVEKITVKPEIVGSRNIRHYE